MCATHWIAQKVIPIHNILTFMLQNVIEDVETSSNKKVLENKIAPQALTLPNCDNFFLGPKPLLREFEFLPPASSSRAANCSQNAPDLCSRIFCAPTVDCSMTSRAKRSPTATLSHLQQNSALHCIQLGQGASQRYRGSRIKAIQSCAAWASGRDTVHRGHQNHTGRASHLPRPGLREAIDHNNVPHNSNRMYNVQTNQGTSVYLEHNSTLWLIAAQIAHFLVMWVVRHVAHIVHRWRIQVTSSACALANHRQATPASWILLRAVFRQIFIWMGTSCPRWGGWCSGHKKIQPIPNAVVRPTEEYLFQAKRYGRQWPPFDFSIQTAHFSVSDFTLFFFHLAFPFLVSVSQLSPGDNYAPPRSSTAGRVGTALSQYTDSQVHKYTNIHIQKYTNTHSKVTIILLFVHTVLAQ